MYDLAKNYDGKPTSLSTIADRQSLPLNYLEQIMLILKKTDMIRSVRGAYGGYILNKEPSDITVKDILDVLEGPISITDCVMDTEDCNNSSYCTTRLIYKEMTDKLNEVTSNITLQDMLDDNQNEQKIQFK
jgi:Rrf2 family protein